MTAVEVRCPARIPFADMEAVVAAPKFYPLPYSAAAVMLALAPLLDDRHRVMMELSLEHVLLQYTNTVTARQFACSWSDYRSGEGIAQRVRDWIAAGEPDLIGEAL